MKHPMAILSTAFAMLALIAAPAGAGSAPAAMSSSVQVEPRAGTWHTWVLTSGSELQPAAPPDQATTQGELAQLHTLESQRDTPELDLVSYWDAGAPAYRWNEMATSRLDQLNAPSSQRGMALISIAISDATVAAWNAKYTFNRPRPSELDGTLHAVLSDPRSPSYPSERAVVAGAASSILAYLFPDDAAAFAGAAEQAGRSRLLAGVEYPSDVTAGLTLGRAVAARVIERAMADGSDATWDGSMPDNSGHWVPNPGTQPVGPLAGTWKTWVLASGNQFRPVSPPAFDSEQEAAELAQIRGFTPSLASDQAVFANSLASYNLWNAVAKQKLFEYRLDANPPRAARTYALLAVAGYDAMVACFDAKYTYWAPRPYHVDPTLTTLLPRYNHPSYPSAHACVAGATSEVLAALFPREAKVFAQQADDLAASRWHAGIHFPTDSDVGLALGRTVGRFVVERAHDPSESN
jgi:membrane-associated phospholipid phosphatase